MTVHIKELKELKEYGQIKQGDVLYIKTDLGNFACRAKIVIRSGQDTEEIVIHKSKNHYFILSMYFDGASWVKNVRILDNQTVYLPYIKGNVKHL